MAEGIVASSAGLCYATCHGSITTSGLVPPRIYKRLLLTPLAQRFRNSHFINKVRCTAVGSKYLLFSRRKWRQSARAVSKLRPHHCIHQMLFLKHAPYLVFKLAGLTGQNDRSLGFEPTYMVIVVEVLLYRRLIRDGSPGRPPRISHSSWALKNRHTRCCMVAFIQRYLRCSLLLSRFTALLSHVVWMSEWSHQHYSSIHSAFFNTHRSGVLFRCYMADATWNSSRLRASSAYTMHQLSLYTLDTCPYGCAQKWSSGSSKWKKATGSLFFFSFFFFIFFFFFSFFSFFFFCNVFSDIAARCITIDKH